MYSYGTDGSIPNLTCSLQDTYIVEFGYYCVVLKVFSLGEQCCESSTVFGYFKEHTWLYSKGSVQLSSQFQIIIGVHYQYFVHICKVDFNAGVVAAGEVITTVIFIVGFIQYSR